TTGAAAHARRHACPLYPHFSGRQHEFPGFSRLLRGVEGGNIPESHRNASMSRRESMTRRALFFVALALGISMFQASLAAPAFAQVGVIGAATDTIYTLAPASGYQDGCFDPCACPVQLNGGLIGAFRLTPAPPDPSGYRIFQVSDLN